MRNAIAVAAFAAGALAAPYHGHQHKRDVVTAVDYDMVTVTDVVYVTAGAPAATTTVAPVADDSSSSSSSSRKHHWNWSSWAWSSSSTLKTVVTSSVAAPAPSSVQTSTSAAPAPSSYEAPSSSTEAPATTEAPSSTWATTSAKPTSTKAAATSSAVAGTYSAVAVDHHNIHRANHSAPSIEWDDDLASTAATIAASCVYAHDTTTNGGGYGQNIAAGVEPNNISTIITDLFYNGEVNWYNGLYGEANPDMTNFEHWGHFSQIVWVDTTHVGCATQDCSAKGLANVGSDVSPYFTVCNYKGPGNYGGEYAKNVLAPKGDPTADWNTGSSVSS